MGSMAYYPSLFLIFFAGFILKTESLIIDVTKHGASGDGVKENSKAFMSSWNQACQSKGENVIMIPLGTYQLAPIIFKGPCKGSIVFQVKGTIRALSDQSSMNVDHWISFQHVEHLTINGGGSFDGQGASIWKKNMCKRNPNCPIGLRLDFVKNGDIQNIKSINSKYVHLSIFGCSNIKVDHVTISAPESSPNTDGIKISQSSNIQILNTHIATGDDCIAILEGTQHLNISGIECGPGHGISIGSLGNRQNEKLISDINVRKVTFTKTTNGVRIKSWASPNSALVSNVKFENIELKDTSNPIIIDQNYCPSKTCAKGSSNVQVKDVTFNNIWGSSATKVAVTLQCSKLKPCKGIVYKDINIKHQSGVAQSACENAQGAGFGKQFPTSCLRK